MPNQSDWCAVEGCGKPSHAKGFCNTHYAQYLRDKANDPKPRGGRRANGTFAPGVSPNPGGRPAGFGDFTRMYREEVPANRKKLRALRDDPKVPPAVQLNAVKEMHDRAYGRSVVPVLQGGMGAMDLYADPSSDGASTPLLRSAKRAEADREVLKQQLDAAREDLRVGRPVSGAAALLVTVKDEES